MQNIVSCLATKIWIWKKRDNGNKNSICAFRQMCGYTKGRHEEIVQSQCEVLSWYRMEASRSPKYLIKVQTVCTRQTSDKRHELVACGVSGPKYCFASIVVLRLTAEARNLRPSQCCCEAFQHCEHHSACSWLGPGNTLTTWQQRYSLYCCQ